MELKSAAEMRTISENIQPFIDKVAECIELAAKDNKTVARVDCDIENSVLLKCINRLRDLGYSTNVTNLKLLVIKW